MGSGDPKFDYKFCDPEKHGEWDEEKNEDNVMKHERSFDEAWPVLEKALKDGRIKFNSRAGTEVRWEAEGFDDYSRHTKVVFTVREGLARMISARGVVPNPIELNA